MELSRSMPWTAGPGASGPVSACRSTGRPWTQLLEPTLRSRPVTAKRRLARDRRIDFAGAYRGWKASEHGVPCRVLALAGNISRHQSPLVSVVFSPLATVRPSRIRTCAHGSGDHERLGCHATVTCENMLPADHGLDSLSRFSRGPGHMSAHPTWTQVSAARWCRASRPAI
jgi:hypothetical protein